MSKTKVVISHHSTEHGTLRTYVTGFILSIVFTLGAYLLVVNHNTNSSSDLIVFFVVCLALAQFMAQLYFFLHLGKETKPRWKLYVFGFMIMVVLILVLGSVWIMNNLNYRMSPEQVNQYMNSQGGGF